MANFTDFNYQGGLSASDFIVGYKGDGTVEQRTTLSDLVSSGLSQKGIYFPDQNNVAIGSDNNQASNISFAQGDSNIAQGQWSTALGVSNKVTGAAAFAHGGLNLASGAISYAGGESNIAEGYASHAEGESSIASGHASHAEGFNNYTGGYITTNGQTYGGAHAEGGLNVVAVPYAHAEGFANKIGHLQFADWYADNPPRLGFGFQNTTLSSLNVYGLNNPLLSSSVRLFFTDESFVRTYSAFVSSTSAAYYDPFSETTAFTIFLKDDETAILPADEYYSPQIICVPLTAYDGSTSFSNIGTGSHAQGYLNVVAGNYAYAQGTNNTVQGYASHAAGNGSSTGPNAINAVAHGNACIAYGRVSHAIGTKAYAAHDYSYVWNSNPNVPGNNYFSSSVSGQYCVNAPGGIALSGGVVGLDRLPTYKTHQTNVAAKNSAWPVISAAQLAETSYYDSGATYAMPGALVIKGHAPAYNNSIQNLPGYGTYGMWLQGVDQMDPGTTFVSDGRAMVTHAMTFRAGINNFTAGSDHNHVQWQGSPSNSTQAWQMTNGGNNGSVYGYQFPYTNRFMVHTLPQYQISTSIAAISGYFDTRIADLGTDSDRLTGVELVVDASAGAGNYSLINVGEVVGFTLNPGLVGLAAVIYETQCTQISSNATGTLSAFQFDFFIGSGNNWSPAFKGIQTVNLKSRANGGNPGVNQITSQIGNPSTQYAGITGSYRGMNKHCLARFTTNSILTGFKPGSPLTLWIPKSMPSSSPIGSGFITSDKISTFALGTFPTGVRSGYFDAFVVNISGGDMEFALCNLMDSYGFENRSWPISAAGTAGWLLYGGTQDTVHRPTFGTTGFYFEREPWSFNGTNFLSGGMVKCVGLGNSEVYGDFSYGLGYRGAVLGKKSGTFAGDYNAVYGDNSVALGGSNLVTTSGNQVVIGTFNDPNTNALFVVGSGASDNRRKNVFEVKGNGDTTQSGFNIRSFSLIQAAGSNQATATEITTEIVTVTGGTGGIRLPATNGGHIIYVKNLYPNAPYSTAVYAPVGGTVRNWGASFIFSGEGTAWFTALSANFYDVF
jgi:hypothetical protein